MEEKQQREARKLKTAMRCNKEPSMHIDLGERKNGLKRAHATINNDNNKKQHRQQQQTTTSATTTKGGRERESDGITTAGQHIRGKRS